MGKRGPAPKPTKVKELQGNPGKRQTNKREPKPKRGAMLPSELNATAAKFIKRMRPVLDDTGILTDADIPALEMMANHYALAWRAAQVVDEQGLIVIDAFGSTHKHPMLQVMKDNSALLRAYMGEFGMTPSSRTRLQVPEKQEVDELEQLLFGSAVSVTK